MKKKREVIRPTLYLLAFALFLVAVCAGVAVDARARRAHSNPLLNSLRKAEKNLARAAKTGDDDCIDYDVCDNGCCKNMPSEWICCDSSIPACICAVDRENCLYDCHLRL